MATRGTSAWRAEVWGKGCDPSVIVAAYWQMGGPKIQCHRSVVGAFRALGRIMRAHHYLARPGVTGAYVCRPITGGSSLSAHAYGIALDVNWDTNPYRLDKLVTDMPRAMVEEIEALQTDKGVKALRWGGDWDGRPETPHSNYDAMHVEAMATPEELRWGFSIPDFDPDDQWTWPMLAFNEKGAAVRRLQAAINNVNVTESPLMIDGFFGTQTQLGVAAYQHSRGLPSDGVVGLGTWTALFSDQGPVAAGIPNPHKGQAVA